MGKNDFEQENSVDLLAHIEDDDPIEIIPPDIEPDPVIPIYPDDDDTTDNYSYYESIWEGQQIDDAIAVILGGEIEGAKDSAKQSAQQAETAKNEALNAKTQAEKAKNEAVFSKNSAEESASRAEQNAEEAEESANTAKQYSGKPAKPQDGTWWIWNAETQKYEDSGKPSIGPKGEQGEPGILVPVDSSAFSLRIDENGHLIATISYNQ